MSLVLPPAKRARVEEDDEVAGGEISTHVNRSSQLAAPTMLFSGHQAAVYTCKFDPTGQYMASGSHDKSIFLWKVYGEDDCNFNVLAGHKNVVLDLCWNRDGSKVISASADKSVGVWDVNVGRRTRTLSKHSGVVNSVGLGEGSLIVSGSDDCTAKVWDVRSRRVEQEFEAKYQITAACFSHDNELIFTAGIDNEIKAWDRRNESVVFVLEGHKDTITGMAVSPNGASLLTNSMDKSLIQWDVRPFVNESRFSKQFFGAQHNMEKNLLKCSWSADGEMVSAGSSDHVVHIWDVPTGEELYHLPGHAGSVNEVAFHPKEPVIASCGSDKQIYLGELNA
mmetsp:Transcript_2709/g.5805  ORF Transcript_2709/g.5805 Transcript_2709/m.5805 type:complete len:337 (-) Transcript_2709:1033-2043(-)|eukprot:CAMPEP_0119483390 /NCGR_PEP_ID=MMETSP1344-20130328/10824_1 /TAXON_ID=236787 /ORGANISM="Florenciella parvula, Strain CCMP2471" /LENGTH=336 /DNA_ID=CAMNT_0007517881 /DNA_START=153 /DNA_END=1163 /DNA_ORIENTATION=+